MLLPIRHPKTGSALLALALALVAGGCGEKRPAVVTDHLDQLAGQVVVGGLVDPGKDGSPRWVGRGWNLPEPLAQWSAESEAELTLPLLAVPQDRRLELRVMGARPGSDPSQLHLRVNGVELPVQALPPRLESLVVEVPAGVLRAGHNRITVACDSLIASGSRSLGVYVDYIRLASGVPAHAPAQSVLTLDANDWIEDGSFTLSTGPLDYEWTHSGSAGELRLEAIDADGQLQSVVDRTLISTETGSCRLTPSEELGPLQPYRLVYESADPASSLRLDSARRTTKQTDDVLLLIVDTLRADHLGVYGSTQTHTASIDSLAHRGTRFTNMVAHSPITGPSHSSYFLSEVPSSTGITNNHRGTLDPSVPTLAEWLRAAGYDNRGTISINPIRSHEGFSRGFASYEEDLGAAFLRAGPLTSVVAESLLSPRQRPTDRPWFTFVHLADPHEPYDDHDHPPVMASLLVNGVVERTFPVSVFQPGYLDLGLEPGLTRLEIRCPVAVRKRRFDLLDGNPAGATLRRLWSESTPTWILEAERPGQARIAYAFEDADQSKSGFSARYSSEVSFTDHQISRVLEALRRSGRADRTWVVFASDHGECLGEFRGDGTPADGQGRFGHVISLREPYVHIPLLVCPPKGMGRFAGKVDDRVAGPIDLVPTMCSALGIAAPPSATGVDLLAEPVPDRAIFLETHTPESPKTHYGLRTKRYKLIWTPIDERYDLYDLQEDPGELHTLTETRPELLKQLQARLDARLQDLLGGPSSTEQVLDDETRAALKSLGYLD